MLQATTQFGQSTLQMLSFLRCVSSICTLHLFLLIFVASSYQQLMPGARYGAVSWIDNDDNLWVFGGLGQSQIDRGYLNDLWKYNFLSDQWTWESGSNISGQIGIYGEKRIASPTNIPGARAASVGWIDLSGNLWLFGGAGVDANKKTGQLNDLWKYDTTARAWTWIAGSNFVNQPGAYEQRGVPSSTAYPGARQDPVSWIDSEGSLWLFGGVFIPNGVYYAFNDLWRFSLTTLRWTWVSGSNTTNQLGVYGEKGTASNTNVPGCRYAAVSWLDSSDNLWLFGGSSYIAGDYKVYSDLWQYNTVISQWTWVSGSNVTGQAGVYGTRGVPSSANFPSARGFSAAAIDSMDTLWLFGAPRINDLWKYNISSNEWTWMNGVSTLDVVGNFGTIRVPSDTNSPPSLFSAVLCTDSNSTLWLFGGGFYNSGGTTPYNSLWLYNTTTNQWTWMSGSNVGNKYGVYSLNQIPTPDPPLESPMSTQPPIEDLPSPLVDAPAQPPFSNSVYDPPVEPSNAVPIGVIVPAVVVPVVAIIALVIGLVFGLRRRKKNESKLVVNNPIPMLSPTDKDKRLIQYSSVTLEQEIGAGSYGKVYIGKWRSTKVAVKVGNSAISSEEFLKEAELQLNIPPHPNIVQLFGVSTDGPRPLVVLEYCNEGSLDKQLFDLNDVLTLEKQLQIAKAAAEGLNHLHENNIVHRDLAARNILMHKGEAKISDFGLSRALNQEAAEGKTASNFGPIRWMAPESLANQTYSTKSDVWMYGVILYEIVARQEPHIGEDVLNVAIKIRDLGLTPTIPNDCPPVLKELMEMCWQVDPQLRPTMAQICEKLDQHIDQ